MNLSLKSDAPTTAGGNQANEAALSISDARAKVMNERSLIRATQYIIAINGSTYSEAAVRDLSELPSDEFSPREAVSALQSVGFAAAFGPMKPTDIRPSHCR